MHTKRAHAATPRTPAATIHVEREASEVFIPGEDSCEGPNDCQRDAAAMLCIHDLRDGWFLNLPLCEDCLDQELTQILADGGPIPN